MEGGGDSGPVRGVASGESGLRDIAGGGMLLFLGGRRLGWDIGLLAN